MNHLPTLINIPDQHRRMLIELCTQQMMDATHVWGMCKSAHYNTHGMSFTGLHELFGEIGGFLLECGDDLAERGLALGGYVDGCIQCATNHTRLKPIPQPVLRQEEWVDGIHQLLAQWANNGRLAIDTCEHCHDPVTQDVFIEQVRSADKYLYKLMGHQAR